MNEKKWRTSAIFWCLLLFLGAMTFVYNITEMKTVITPGSYLLNHISTIINDTQPSYIPASQTKGYLIKTPGCTIPEMKPMDPLVRKYIFREKPVICNNNLPPLFESNRTSLYLLPESLTDYNITNAENLTCCFQYFRRRDPLVDESDKKIHYNSTCYNITHSADVDPNEEYLRIKCQYNSREIYKDFFNYVPIKPDTNPISSSITTNKLNVLVIGIDAVSRVNFHRQMPKTAFYLDKLNAIELLGYNKVGDNTFPNLIAALTGKTEKELQRTCWPKTNSFFDDCDFVWKGYKRAGYTTAFGEDAAWMGTFLYTRRGFHKQPTDYYFDHFDITSTHEIGNSHRMNVDQCIGSRQVYQVFLNYIDTFTRVMHENVKTFFAFFWSASLSHDYLNKPKLGDQDFLNLIFNLDEEGMLNNTALILMSDHGIRWGDIRSTYQGRMEERLPFVYIVLPEWYRTKYSTLYNNLRRNARRLTTPFDLHETFTGILNDHTHSKSSSSASNDTHTPRGISLFQYISENRTCRDAGIDTHWCTCQTSVKVDQGSEDVQEAVNSTIDHINNLLIGYADCQELKLDKIIDARELTNDNSMKGLKKSVQDYTVTFQTTPGGAIFEATVRKNMVDEDAHFSITGTVSRINLYGSQSNCITDFHLKLYCYCRTYFGN